MSCYFRHIRDVLDEAGVTVTSENRKEIDRVLHGIAGVPYKDCSPAWKKIKETVKGKTADRERFVGKLKKAIQGE